MILIHSVCTILIHVYDSATGVRFCYSRENPNPEIQNTGGSTHSPTKSENLKFLQKVKIFYIKGLDIL